MMTLSTASALRCDRCEVADGTLILRDDKWDYVDVIRDIPRSVLLENFGVVEEYSEDLCRDCLTTAAAETDDPMLDAYR